MRSAFGTRTSARVAESGQGFDLSVYHYLTMNTERDIRIGNLFEEFRIWWQSEDGDVATFLADTCGAIRPSTATSRSRPARIACRPSRRGCRR